jgi:hypothetical protein
LVSLTGKYLAGILLIILLFVSENIPQVKGSDERIKKILIDLSTCAGQI